MSQNKEQKIDLNTILLLVVILVPTMLFSKALPFESSISRIAVAATLSGFSAAGLALVKTRKGKIVYTVVLVILCFALAFVL